MTSQYLATFSFWKLVFFYIFLQLLFFLLVTSIDTSARTMTWQKLDVPEQRRYYHTATRYGFLLLFIGGSGEEETEDYEYDDDTDFQKTNTSKDYLLAFNTCMYLSPLLYAAKVIKDCISVVMQWTQSRISSENIRVPMRHSSVIVGENIFSFGGIEKGEDELIASEEESKMVVNVLSLGIIFSTSLVFSNAYTYRDV